MGDQRSADALRLIARIKRIPQPVSDEVEARHSQREREAGCNREPRFFLLERPATRLGPFVDSKRSDAMQQACEAHNFVHSC